MWAKYVLPRLLGLKMCPNCPHCNADDSRSRCQDIFGSNMLPLGGIFGAMESFGGAVENKRGGTPHLHFNTHLASAYQHLPLLEIAQLIEEELLRCTRRALSISSSGTMRWHAHSIQAPLTPCAGWIIGKKLKRGARRVNWG